MCWDRVCLENAFPTPTPAFVLQARDRRTRVSVLQIWSLQGLEVPFQQLGSTRTLEGLSVPDTGVRPLGLAAGGAVRKQHSRTRRVLLRLRSELRGISASLVASHGEAGARQRGVTGSVAR